MTISTIYLLRRGPLSSLASIASREMSKTLRHVYQRQFD